MKNKGILFLMDYAAPYPGNFIPSVSMLEKKLKERENRAVFVFPSKAKDIPWVKDFQLQDRKVYFFSGFFRSKRFHLGEVRRLSRIIKRERIHAIHTHFMANNYSLFLISLLHRRLRIIGHFQNHFQPPNNRYRKLKIFVVKHSYHLIIGASPSVSESVRQVGISPDKVDWAHSSLDTDHLQSSTAMKLNGIPGQISVLMFGWRYHRKGVDYAISAVSELNREGNKIILALAYACDDSLIEQEIRKQLGEIPSWIRLLGSNSDVASLYNSADIFLSSSREEGYTYSVLEAAYCRPMIIVSRIGGHPQDIPHAVVYDMEDREALKNAILDLGSLSEKDREIIRSEQRSYVEETYSIEDWAEKVFSLYNKLLNL